MSTEHLRTVNYHVSEHFLYSDFICPCCDMLKIVPGFYKHIECLEKLIECYGKPFEVTSGYRCLSHNRSVGGAPKSWHLLFATDLVPAEKNGEELKLLYNAAMKVGFTGLGLYDAHVHVDVRPKPAQWRG